MEFFQFLQQNHSIFYSVVIFIGLSFGSFLNVVIHRLPRMMENDWKNQCRELLGQSTNHENEKYTLAFPCSTCPQCGHKIRFWENIPVISYILLHGRCSSCKTKISLQYPIIETTTALLSVVVAYKFGVTLQTLAALMFTWSLIALTVIDFQTQLLPDDITYPLLWLGLLFNLNGVYVTLEESVIGAMVGYLALWSVYHLFKLVTGKEGMGYGDFKLLAALGAWMGWKMLPIIILLSSLVGAIIGISMILFVRHDKNIPIPFGPYLAMAGWIALIWGNDLLHFWLG